MNLTRSDAPLKNEALEMFSGRLRKQTAMCEKRVPSED